MPERIGRYRVTRTLGQGGMGIVYAAHDDRLDRDVAIKVVRPEIVANPVAFDRFRREARAAARVSHQNICALYELDEDAGQPFLVMELLQGESLAARLERGALPVEEAIAVADAILDALSALHRRGVIHRDLKPANIFLTDSGVKLVDFGLARRPGSSRDTGETDLTDTGVLAGTPRYMAPEQLRGEAADERSDVFAAAAVTYEMIAGRPAFDGRTLVEIVHKVGYEEPPELRGPDPIPAIDRVLRQALDKDPAHRLPRADRFKAAIHAARAGHEPVAAPVHRSVTRFVALPLVRLKPDAETDFLAFSVPDAVSAALAGVEGLIVRATRDVGEKSDMRALGKELSADVILTGTLLRVGPQVRVAARLNDAESGTLIWSDTAQAPIDDLFQLQDTLTERIVTSLSLPLTPSDRRTLAGQASASAEAYELYMRANDLMTDSGQWDVARGLYERAVAIDPDFAPAWARLGRARRLMAKWGGPNSGGALPAAEAAFRRALELNPDLSIAHDLSAYAEAELGLAPEAMERLLRRAGSRRTDVGLLAGLVTTCRYAGLFEASLAADRLGKNVDPALVTSVAWTHFVRGDYETAARLDNGSPPFCLVVSRALLGTIDASAVRALEAGARASGARLALKIDRLILDGRIDDALAAIGELRAQGFADPEGIYASAVMLAAFGSSDAAIALLDQVVKGGYACHTALTSRPEWTKLAGHADYDAIVAATARMVEDSRGRFDAASGADVLGVPAS
jgi:non-specific serine/threonine protein kinase